MHSHRDRTQALDLLASGLSRREVASRTGVPVRTLSDWAREPRAISTLASCPRCDGGQLASGAYAELLGWYLGDGHLSRHRGDVWRLRIFNDARYADLNDGLTELIRAVRPGARASQQLHTGCVVTSSWWKHWPCLFPQHGVGMKHQRAIVLEPWQRTIVETHPGPFLTGLFHSDGCRVRNWATRPVAGVTKRYEYPRWQFSNRSEDILGLCTWALDLAEIPWRRSHRWMVSVSRRDAMARLDGLVGLKS